MGLFDKNKLGPHAESKPLKSTGILGNLLAPSAQKDSDNIMFEEIGEVLKKYKEDPNSIPVEKVIDRVWYNNVLVINYTDKRGNNQYTVVRDWDKKLYLEVFTDKTHLPTGKGKTRTYSMPYRTANETALRSAEYIDGIIINHYTDGVRVPLRGKRRPPKNK